MSTDMATAIEDGPVLWCVYCGGLLLRADGPCPDCIADRFAFVPIADHD
jgi:rubrerythrin